MEQNLQEEEAPQCDPTTKHLAGTRPAGMSNAAYIRCVYPDWEWYDPQIAE